MFDNFPYPTVDEILAVARLEPAAPAGKCKLPGSCVVAQQIANRLTEADARVEVYPCLPTNSTGKAEVRFSIVGDYNSGRWFPLPSELNALALGFDRLHEEGVVVTHAEIIPICEEIIASRWMTA